MSTTASLSEPTLVWGWGLTAIMRLYGLRRKVQVVIIQFCRFSAAVELNISCSDSIDQNNL